MYKNRYVFLFEHAQIYSWEFVKVCIFLYNKWKNFASVMVTSWKCGTQGTSIAVNWEPCSSLSCFTGGRIKPSLTALIFHLLNTVVGFEIFFREPWKIITRPSEAYKWGAAVQGYLTSTKPLSTTQSRHQLGENACTPVTQGTRMWSQTPEIFSSLLLFLRSGAFTSLIHGASYLFPQGWPAVLVSCFRPNWPLETLGKWSAQQDKN